MPGPIPPELVTEGVFVFLGKRQPIGRIDYEMILDDFDRLLPLYKYVESGGESQPVSMPSEVRFAFQRGYCVKVSSTKAAKAQAQLDVQLRTTNCKRLYIAGWYPCTGPNMLEPNFPVVSERALTW